MVFSFFGCKRWLFYGVVVVPLATAAEPCWKLKPVMTDMICVARISVCRPLVVVTSGSANSSVPRRCSKAWSTTWKLGLVKIPVMLANGGKL